MAAELRRNAQHIRDQLHREVTSGTDLLKPWKTSAKVLTAFIPYLENAGS
jgi:hypothetical protein